MVFGFVCALQTRRRCIGETFAEWRDAWNSGGYSTYLQRKPLQVRRGLLQAFLISEIGTLKVFAAAMTLS